MNYDPERVHEAIQHMTGAMTDVDAEAWKQALYKAREEGSRPSERPYDRFKQWPS